tara:strand:- start:216 stop:1478 length:1263 start_codon:yes stop_codon:yes gene_type:complete
MAIHFHEGLPGAGKSYEACVYHILPALKANRQVITNIRGMNLEKIASLIDEPVEYVEMLLICIDPAEQDGDESELQRVKNDFADKTPDNAMIVWDEVQDYYPSGNYKLPINQQKFWTEHRHRGLEIVIMGQDRDDVHKIIRSRIEDIVYFLKLKAVGRPNQYKWEHYEKQSKGRFVKIGSGVRSYDTTYFGIYASHRREGVKAGVYQTSRSNVLANSKLLSLGVPVAFCAAIFAVYHLYGFFNPAPKSSQQVAHVQQPKKQDVYTPPTLVNPEPDTPLPKAATAAHVQEELPAPIDYLDNLAQKYQIRAAAIIDSQKAGKEVMGQVELLDDTYHLKERFTLAEIRALGWKITRTGYGLLLEKQNVAYVARTWPLDLYGRVDQRTSQSLNQSGSGSPRQTDKGHSGATVTVVNSGKPGHLW